MKVLPTSSKFITAVLILQCGLAFTQETSPRPLPQAAPPDPQVAIGRDVHHGARVTLVAVAEPLRRRPCLVDTFKDETVSCSPDKGVAAASYKETELVAILKRNERESGFSIKRFLGTFGFGAGAIAGAAFLIAISPVAAIPVAVLGGIFLLDATIESLDQIGRGPSERVVYLNPTQQLQIALR
jgi:hypothetical protein